MKSFPQKRDNGKQKYGEFVSRTIKTTRSRADRNNTEFGFNQYCTPQELYAEGRISKVDPIKIY